MNIVDLVGWLGAGLLAICSFPQTIKNIKEGSSRNLSPLFIWFWFSGELFTFIYICLDKFSWSLFFNYALNLTFSAVLLKLYYFPTIKNEAGKHNK